MNYIQPSNVSEDDFELQGSPGLRLLCLDGGGIRGLSELFILKRVMEEIQHKESLPEMPRPCDYFDMIGGSNTGGLFAIMLGRLRMSVEQAIASYKYLAEQVFFERKRFSFCHKFSARRLEAVMKDIVVEHDESQNKDALMRSDESALSECKTFVCATPLLNKQYPRLFRSYDVRADQDLNCTIWEAARATTAIPAFFNSIFIGDSVKEEFIDSGLDCNNPVMEVLEEARYLFGKRPVACIVSIGAGSFCSTCNATVLQCLLPSNLSQVLERLSAASEKVSKEMYNEKDGPREYFRFNMTPKLRENLLFEWQKTGDVESDTLRYLGEDAVKANIDKLRDILRARVLLR
ncbi:hypothetical protein H2248_002181 [Termitomyces sp. 'cryptogamus']|nr:hypothetical protein H2248_002181 [Termitomyces sp. 'cryptogamus']